MKVDIDTVLNLKPEVPEQNKKLQSVLRSIKPIKRELEKQGITKGDVPIDILEKTLHGLCIRYKYIVMNIQPYYGKDCDEFIFYTSSIKRLSDHGWVGNAYGITMYETIAKLVIRVFWDIKYYKEENRCSEN